MTVIDGSVHGYAGHLHRLYYTLDDLVVTPGKADDGALPQGAVQRREVVVKAIERLISRALNSLLGKQEVLQLDDEETADWAEVSRCFLERWMLSVMF